MSPQKMDELMVLTAIIFRDEALYYKESDNAAGNANPPGYFYAKLKEANAVIDPSETRIKDIEKIWRKHNAPVY